MLRTAMIGLLVCLLPLAISAAKADGSVRIIDHSLVERSGEAMRFREDVIGDHRVVVGAIYTGCSTICPITTAIFQNLEAALDDQGMNDVRLVSLTLDPANDTPDALTEAADMADAGPNWLWLTGDKPLLDEVLYGLGAYSRDIVEHPPVFIVGNGETGEYRQLFGFPAIDEFIAELDKLDG